MRERDVIILAVPFSLYSSYDKMIIQNENNRWRDVDFISNDSLLNSDLNKSRHDANSKYCCLFSLPSTMIELIFMQLMQKSEHSIMFDLIKLTAPNN